LRERNSAKGGGVDSAINKIKGKGIVVSAKEKRKKGVGCTFDLTKWKKKGECKMSGSAKGPKGREEGWQ